MNERDREQDQQALCDYVEQLEAERDLPKAA